MRYGIISDIHGNLEALEVAINALSGDKIDQYLCVGDIVGYGADPIECIKKTKALNAVIVLGNHDAASADSRDLGNFADGAREAIVWTRKNISSADSAFLKKLDLVYKNRHLTMVHGSLREPEQFHYIFDRDEALPTLDLMETRVCFIGHSHMPGIITYKDGKLTSFHKEKAKLSKDEKMIVNAGSVGQPRDGDPRLCYVIFDTDKGVIEFKRLPYDAEKAGRKILKKGLPPFLAYRLSEGV